ncbi:MAG: SH3 domain-containing protein, partial [Desulfobacterales bacterium]|nr:SH3 domain-containing protein [Desulfobacterales bacterium]
MTRFREGVLAVLLVLLCTWIATAQETIPFDPPRKATVTTANVNLRSGPGQDYPIVGGVKNEGLIVDARAQNGEWVKIKFTETEAWIKAEFLKIEPPAATATDQSQTGAAVTDPAVAADDSDREAADDIEAQEDAAEGILIKSILFEGNDVIGSGELSEAVKDYVGKPLTMEEMGELTDQITIVYQEKGF